MGLPYMKTSNSVRHKPVSQIPITLTIGTGGPLSGLRERVGSVDCPAFLGPTAIGDAAMHGPTGRLEITTARVEACRSTPALRSASPYIERSATRRGAPLAAAYRRACCSRLNRHWSPASQGVRLLFSFAFKPVSLAFANDRVLAESKEHLIRTACD